MTEQNQGSKRAPAIGRLIASTLRGAWRQLPPQLDLTADELLEISPLLLGSRAGALAWWKAQHSSLRDTPAGKKLEGAYRVYNVENIVHQSNLRSVFDLLRNEGIEPILVKGFAAAQYYPKPALRPYMDFDLVVPPAEEMRAAEIVRANDCRNIDLMHWEVNRFDNSSYDTLFERSRTIPLDDAEIRVPSPEDHLRLLCVHLLKHGGTRPIWLCDIGAAIEAVTSEFDWERLARGDRKRAVWVAYVVGLAYRLLDARIDNTPFYSIAKSTPRWMEQSLLKDWSTPRRILHVTDTALETSLNSRAEFFTALRHRWRNPIEVTVIYGGSFNRFASVINQIRYFTTVALKFAVKLVRRKPRTSV